MSKANADGGLLVVGLHDGLVEDVPPQRRNELRQVALDFTHPPVRVRVQEVLAASAGGDPVTLVVFPIKPGEQVHTTQKGSCYLRVGDESRQLTAAQQRELVYDRGAAHYEATPVDLGVDDLDQDQLASYARAIGASSIEGMLAARDLVDRRDHRRRGVGRGPPRKAHHSAGHYLFALHQLQRKWNRLAPGSRVVQGFSRWGVLYRPGLA